jgi:hypothetical protein
MDRTANLGAQTRRYNMMGRTLPWRRERPKTQEDRPRKVIPLAGIITAAAVIEAGRFNCEEEDASVLATMWETEPTTDGFYLLERITNSTVRNVQVDLVYDDRLPVGRVLQSLDTGEVIQLVNPTECIFDTANADEPE